jgi:crossover junction endodeoxyribonuclease RusA
MTEITLPWPPSVNSYWRTFQGRMIISAEGRAFRERVEVLLMRSDIAPIHTGPIKVEIEAFRPDRRRRDLDNLLKATLDALAHAHVYEDDSQIVDLRIYWADIVGGMLKVKVSEI